jgi:hypothetical protein
LWSPHGWHVAAARRRRWSHPTQKRFQSPLRISTLVSSASPSLQKTATILHWSVSVL